MSNSHQTAQIAAVSSGSPHSPVKSLRNSIHLDISPRGASPLKSPKESPAKSISPKN